MTNHWRDTKDGDLLIEFYEAHLLLFQKLLSLGLLLAREADKNRRIVETRTKKTSRTKTNGDHWLVGTLFVDQHYKEI